MNISAPFIKRPVGTSLLTLALLLSGGLGIQLPSRSNCAVLGVLYESYIHPVTILSTLPSAGVGALLALLITHNELNGIGLIGIILLIGMVKKNAIMRIDFALEAERGAGKSPREVIHEACLLRGRILVHGSGAHGGDA